MRKILLLAGVLTLTGCAWLGFGDDSTTVAADESATPVADAAAEASAPAAAAGTAAEQAPTASKTSKAKKTAKPVKGAKTEAQIKAELDAMGKKLASQSARTLLPNKSKPDFRQIGKEWVASYIDVDTNNITTELRPSPNGNGQYVGFVRYQEKFMECRGATRQTALSGNCQQVRARNLNELIRYDGKQWQD